MTVFSRILAVVLAGMIGLPMCWCCPAMAAPSSEHNSVQVTKIQSAAHDEHACCHTEKQSQADADLPASATHQHQSSQNCPCEAQLGSRDLVSRDIVVPAPEIMPLLVQFWQPITLLMIPATPLVEVHAEWTDDTTLYAGLPPLYEQYCALLL